MFGGGNRKKDADKPSSLVAAMTPENAPSSSSSSSSRGGSGGGSSVTGFDPEGLERAAKAARELDASRNASAAIDLIKTQEASKQVRRSELRSSWVVMISYDKLKATVLELWGHMYYINLFAICKSPNPSAFPDP